VRTHSLYISVTMKLQVIHAQPGVFLAKNTKPVGTSRTPVEGP
jgi:hypothetical protein